MINPIKLAFKNAKEKKRPALLTYTVAGDNTKKKSLEILKSISKNVDICEIGFPHNTPIADGGQIQTSAYRALKNGLKISDVFQIVRDFKKSKNSKPVILMGYYNMIYQYGGNNFIKKCKSSGVNGLIVVASKERLKNIIKDSHDMIYYISMLSTTGGKLKVSSKQILNNYNKIKKIDPKKNCVIGFGITEKTIAKLRSADGLVVGSAICKEITRSLNNRQNPVTNVSKVVAKLRNKIS